MQPRFDCSCSQQKALLRLGHDLCSLDAARAETLDALDDDTFEDGAVGATDRLPLLRRATPESSHRYTSRLGKIPWNRDRAPSMRAK